MLPNLLIIGAPKCGTTSLHGYLAEHPEIFMSRRKELMYFTRDDWDTPEARAWYERQFAEADGERWRGESTPIYAQHPFRWRTADRIHATVPDARLVYCVRDPIPRLISHYFERRMQQNVSSFDEWLAGWRDPRDRIFSAGRYATQLQVYVERFLPDQILVVDQHDLQSERDATLRRVFAWLGVDEAFTTPAFDVERNTRGAKGAPRMPKWMWRGVVAAGQRVPPRVRARVGAGAKRVLLRSFDEQPVIEGELREEMEAELRPEVQWLRDFTGQRFASWSI